MIIKILKNENAKQTKVTIEHPRVLDKETKELIQYLNNHSNTTLGYKNNQVFRILINDIYYIEYVDEKTFLYLKNDIYLSKYKLYEWEHSLKNTSFIRISKSTILNIHYLKSVKPLLGSKMEVTLKNDERLIVNRHYISSFKKKFGL